MPTRRSVAFGLIALAIAACATTTSGGPASNGGSSSSALSASEQPERPVDPDSCPPTTAIRSFTGADGGHVPGPFNIGEDLAGPVSMVAGEGTKGYLWVYRSAAPPPLLLLRAEQIDVRGHRAPSPPIAFEVFLPVGRQDSQTLWTDGAPAHVYLPTQMGSALTRPGCWRVSVMDGPNPGSVVVWIRPKPAR